MTAAVIDGPSDLDKVNASPNPFSQDTAVNFDLARQDIVTVAVYDPAGRQLKLLHSARMERGPQRVTWDGTDAAGKPAASGTYYLRVRTSEGTQAVKVVRVP